MEPISVGPDQRIQFLLVSVVGLAKVTWAFSLTGGMGEVWGSVLNQNTWLLVSSFLFLLVQGLGTVAAFLGSQGAWPEHALSGAVSPSARPSSALNLEKALGY